MVMILAGNFGALAQSPPPDMRMLLNLDLFATAPSDSPPEPGAASGSDSMLNQIQTLQALGYLHRGRGPAPVVPQPAALPSSPYDTDGDEP
jgi:hypothetical protein